MLAAYQGHERVVDLLLRHGAEVNLQASDGYAALAGAAFNGHPAVVLQLLRAGADMALRTAAGRTALQIAKEKGHTECVAAVKTVLGEVAAERRDAAAVEAGGAGAGSASGGEGGSSGPVPEEIGEAGGAGADGDAASGKGAAAAPTNKPPPDSFDEEDQPLSQRKQTAASSSGGVESGTGEDAVPEEIAEAARQGEEAALLAWLDGGGRVDANFTLRGCERCTLLMTAARQGHERVVELLLQRGAEVNVVDSLGGTAMMYAAHQGRERVVKLLLRHGAEINLQDSYGVTTLTSGWPSCCCSMGRRSTSRTIPASLR
ncbi:hypothetical protein EMIHUDRAFT_431850 [Emiliania huxleyi CCMP1516]|uniref:Uncharacterized protein n=2 Tax=Emiliania huxleyi TaxID=2903 RepID=A0A0D3L1I8_EMIH1|nr:hypothetical protein EMIHUDRAFT_431850 [Emiliania huxleyi CCMP1516]EOD41873.1 hypothetical protein EMIHUDRAFT_431850 [Emiliania huxleyi CCMP1516]|eukprot:XP_005794302.1 hypothetical protein EMIHUDRAFT_431850 [Emiliania huxleyi CCMP1516]